MNDYRVPKALGGFNLQKLYAEILKSKSTDNWYMERYEDSVLIADYRSMYVVPGKYPLADDFILERPLKKILPDWDNGVPCVDTKTELILSDKKVAKVFRMGEKDFYFDKTLFKYFTDEAFAYRMSESGSALYVAYKGKLIAMILGIRISE